MQRVLLNFQNLFRNSISITKASLNKDNKDFFSFFVETVPLICLVMEKNNLDYKIVFNYTILDCDIIWCILDDDIIIYYDHDVIDGKVFNKLFKQINQLKTMPSTSVFDSNYKPLIKQFTKKPKQYYLKKNLKLNLGRYILKNSKKKKITNTIKFYKNTVDVESVLNDIKEITSNILLFYKSNKDIKSNGYNFSIYYIEKNQTYKECLEKKQLFNLNNKLLFFYILKQISLGRKFSICNFLINVELPFFVNNMILGSEKKQDINGIELFFSPFIESHFILSPKDKDNNFCLCEKKIITD